MANSIRKDNYDGQLYLVVDLEATCCNQNEFPVSEMEIIEIGGVMVNAKFEPIDEFSTFVKPVRHPKITDFCTELTSITQQDVDNAPGYKEASRAFATWLKAYPNIIWSSWGNYDNEQFFNDAAFHNEKHPIHARHINLKKAFSKKQKIRKYVGMSRALKLANIVQTGKHHRGIDDARNIVKLLPFIFGDAQI